MLQQDYCKASVFLAHKKNVSNLFLLFNFRKDKKLAPTQSNYNFTAGNKYYRFKNLLIVFFLFLT